MKSSLHRIWLLAANTLLEATRTKLFRALLLAAIVLVGGSTFFAEFDFGADQLGFVRDFGVGIIYVTGAFLGISLPVVLMVGEMEHRTALTLLAKPIRVVEFLLGKQLGTMLLLALFVFPLALGLLTLLLSRLSGMPTLAPGTTAEFSLDLVLLFQQVIAIWMLASLTAAMGLLSAVFANSLLYGLALSFGAYLAACLQGLTRPVWEQLFGTAGKWTLELTSRLIPDFSLYSLETSAGGWVKLGILLLYTLIYLVAYVGTAALMFRRERL